jgi:hypothetical protein
MIPKLAQVAAPKDEPAAYRALVPGLIQEVRDLDDAGLTKAGVSPETSGAARPRADAPSLVEAMLMTW